MGEVDKTIESRYTGGVGASKLLVLGAGASFFLALVRDLPGLGCGGWIEAGRFLPARFFCFPLCVLVPAINRLEIRRREVKQKGGRVSAASG